MNAIPHSGKSIVVAGCGATGSHAIAHLPRITGVSRVILVDPDICEEGNLAGQQIFPDDVDRPKVLVHARRLRRFTHLTVETWKCRIEDVPLGRLRADAMLSCLDSRAARRYMNQAAWRLGVPLIDCAVSGPDYLARVNAYLPGRGNTCLECAWSPQQYADQETKYPCQKEGPLTAPTRAASALGGLAASMQILELEIVLSGRLDEAAVGRQVMVDARYHRLLSTVMPRNPKCRFDHEVWMIRPLDAAPGWISLGELFELAGNPVRAALRCEGRAFIGRRCCGNGCSPLELPARLDDRLLPRHQRCPECGAALVSAGFDAMSRLYRRDLGKTALRRPMSSLGFRPGDVVSLESPGEATLHVEFASDCCPAG